VPAPGAADGHREVLLALLDEAGQGDLEQLAQPLHVAGGVLLGEHVVAHGRVAAGLRAQLGDPVRVGQEAHVQDHVGVQRQPVLEAEGADRDPQPGRLAAAEGGGDLASQLVDVQVAGVDDQVGVGPQLQEQLALAGDGVDHALAGDRVAAPGRLVPAHEDLVGCLQEQDSDLDALASEGVQLAAEVADGLGEGAPAGVDDQGDPAGGGAGAARGQDGDPPDERRGQVVDHEVAEVLEHLGRLGPAGARHAGDHDELEWPVVAPPPRGVRPLARGGGRPGLGRVDR
jgi:hypothetical protein